MSYQKLLYWFRINYGVQTVALLFVLGSFACTYTKVMDYTIFIDQAWFGFFLTILSFSAFTYAHTMYLIDRRNRIKSAHSARMLDDLVIALKSETYSTEFAMLTTVINMILFCLLVFIVEGNLL